MPEPPAIRFTTWATYAKRRQCEAVIGTYPNERRLIIKQVLGSTTRYDVSTPVHSSVRLHGESTRTGGELLARDLPLRAAKAFAAAWLGRHTP